MHKIAFRCSLDLVRRSHDHIFDGSLLCLLVLLLLLLLLLLLVVTVRGLSINQIAEAK